MQHLVVRRVHAALVAVDIAVAMLLAAIGITELRSVGDDIFYRSADGLGMALVLVQTLPLAVRRLAPLVATAVVVAGSTTMLAAGYPQTNALLAVPLALYSVAAHHSRRTTALTVVGVLAVLVPVLATTQSNSFSFMLVAVVVFAVGAFAGDGVRSRRLYAEAVELKALQERQEQELATRETAMAERARIARELHDAIGHTVNVIVIQAGAGRLAAPADAERCVEAFSAIEEIGRATLGDIDRLLGVLRDDEEPAVQRRPRAGVRELAGLVDRLRGAGLDVQFELTGDRQGLPAPVDAATYRIVQESLTNALKHAPGAPVTASVAIGPAAVRIDVVDGGGRGSPGVAPAATSGGRGLVGMRERVSLLGGEIQAGPTEHGFSVRAVLPLSPRPGTGQAETASPLQEVPR